MIANTLWYFSYCEIMLLSGICLLGHYSTATLQYVFEVVVICFFSMYLFEFHFIERIYVSIDMYIYIYMFMTDDEFFY